MEQVSGEKVRLVPVDMDQMIGLGLHLRKTYQLYRLQLLQQELILAIPSNDDSISPKRASKVIAAIEAQVHKPVVLAVDHLPAYLRNRYIEHRISFVVPGQQVFLPNFMFDLRSQKDRKQIERDHFRPSTQCMLLFHILVQPLNGMRQDQIASLLGYSDMTISRAVKEFRNKDLVKKGKAQIHFNYQGLDLWINSKGYLQSPIRKISYTSEAELIAHCLTSGLNALGHYTDIAGENKLTVAMSADEYKDFEKLHTEKINDHYGSNTIEVWNYDPQLLTQSNYVDPISLFLSMDDTDGMDERTTISLDQLINKIYD